MSGKLKRPAPNPARFVDKPGDVILHRASDKHVREADDTNHFYGAWEGGGAGSGGHPMTAAEAGDAQDAAKAKYEAEVEKAPNLRDFGLDKRDEYEHARDEWNARCNALKADWEQAAKTRFAIWKAEQAKP
jgi:hypothetical protein